MEDLILLQVTAAHGILLLGRRIGIDNQQLTDGLLADLTLVTTLLHKIGLNGILVQIPEALSLALLGVEGAVAGAGGIGYEVVDFALDLRLELLGHGLQLLEARGWAAAGVREGLLVECTDLVEVRAELLNMAFDVADAVQKFLLG